MVNVAGVAHNAKPVVVVGLGSTGSALAARLSKLGHEVVGLERYAGTVEGRVYDVAPSSIDMLASWGVADEVTAGAARGLEHAPATSNMDALLAGMDGRDSREWLNITKSTVDTALRDIATRNGARLLTGTPVERVEHLADGGVRVFASGLDEPIEGSLLIYADGGREASQAAFGSAGTTFPERARYLGAWFDSGSDDAARAIDADDVLDGFSYRPADGDGTLVWSRVHDDVDELVTPSARELRSEPELTGAATRFVEEHAEELGAAGTARGDATVADVQLRLADRIADEHGAIGVGDLVAGVPFDRSQGFNAGILEAERATRYVQEALVPGADRAALAAAYERDVLAGARELVEHSRRSLAPAA